MTGRLPTIAEVTAPDPDCQICAQSGWVCEQHPDKPWDGEVGQPEGCEPDCSGPGMPCGCTQAGKEKGR